MQLPSATYAHSPTCIPKRHRTAISQGFGVLCRPLGVTQQTYYRWRKEYGGLKVNQAKRLKELERENGRLRQAVADLTLDKPILKEAASGNF